MNIECNGCGKQFDEVYEYCPHCGTRRGDFKLMKYNQELKKKEKRKKRKRAIFSSKFIRHRKRNSRKIRI